MPSTSRFTKGVLTGSFADFLTAVLTLAGGFSAFGIQFESTPFGQSVPKRRFPTLSAAGHHKRIR
jgi:hypothetical protein